MKVKEIIHANRPTAAAWGRVGRAAVVTALAAIIFLAVGSPISAEVTQGVPSTGGSEHDGRAKEADRLATDNSAWFRAAHRKAGNTAEEQPLPAQF